MPPDETKPILKLQKTGKPATPPTPVPPVTEKPQPLPGAVKKKDASSKDERKKKDALFLNRVSALNEHLNRSHVWLECRPLAIGICEVIFSELQAEGYPGLTLKLLKKIIKGHVKSKSYLQALAQGGPRYRMDRTVDGEITEPQQKFAAVLLSYRAKSEADRQAKRASSSDSLTTPSSADAVPGDAAGNA